MLQSPVSSAKVEARVIFSWNRLIQQLVSLSMNTVWLIGPESIAVTCAPGVASSPYTCMVSGECAANEVMPVMCIVLSANACAVEDASISQNDNAKIHVAFFTKPIVI